MVLQKRLDYGFIGYQVPPTPRATRSARKRRSFAKKADDNRMCAFDLLATVAGKLLLEGEISPSASNTLTGEDLFEIVKDSIKKEEQHENSPSKVEPRDQGSFGRTSFVSDLHSQVIVLHQGSKEFLHAHNDDCSGLASVITTSDSLERVACAEKLVNGKSKIQLESIDSKVEAAFSGYREPCDCTLDNEHKKHIKMETSKAGNASVSIKADIHDSDDQEVRDRKHPAFVSVDGGKKFLLCTNHNSGGSFPAYRDDVNLVIRDDDENSSGCIRPRTKTKAFRQQPRIGDRRIRKLLASKYWKVTPRMKDDEHFSADSEIKSVYHNRRNFYKRQRSQRDYPFKKRRLYDFRTVSNTDRGISSEGISGSPRKGFNCDASGSAGRILGASGPSTCVAGQQTPFQSRDSHVKLRIKSFKVPELFIEISETATVGSLKRTVMEAVTAILRGGLQVGVLLQGKQIRDDNKTLLQTGISHDDELDALGFSLEPNSSQGPPPLCHEDHPFLLTCDKLQPLTRYPPASGVLHNVGQQGTADALPGPPLSNLGNFVESDHDSASSPDMSIDKSPIDSRALVAVPATPQHSLAVVPMRKSKRSEASQRRIRRPFSVSEVEALVQAVEKLGTGRWRDVKLRAFDSAKHRTYVDLKDKWKTLVHTARISPQQRRGEPVPQELLDRVLTAHAYWSQQQAKQQLKQQHPQTCHLI